MPVPLAALLPDESPLVALRDDEPLDMPDEPPDVPDEPPDMLDELPEEPPLALPEASGVPPAPDMAPVVFGLPVPEVPPLVPPVTPPVAVPPDERLASGVPPAPCIAPVVPGLPVPLWEPADPEDPLDAPVLPVPDAPVWAKTSADPNDIENASATAVAILFFIIHLARLEESNL